MKRPQSLPYVQAFADRYGRWRYYYRRRGRKRVRLPGKPGDREFMAAYIEADRGPESASAVDLGTFSGLAHAYRRSANFISLRESTKTTYRREIDRFCAEHGSKRVAHLQRRHIREMMAARAAASGPEAGNNLFRIVRILCAFAIDNEVRADNPTLGVRRFRKQGDGFPAWSEEDVASYLTRWGAGSVERLALVLLLYTGQRRSDVIRMGWQHVRGDTIRVSQSKTGAQLVIPMHPELGAVLQALSKDQLTFLTTQYGKPFKNSAAFGNRFRQWCDAAGLPNRSAHGLRKSAAVRLVEAGCSSKEVAAITGHASLREIERYTRAAEQEKLARAAIARLIQSG